MLYCTANLSVRHTSAGARAGYDSSLPHVSLAAKGSPWVGLGSPQLLLRSQERLGPTHPGQATPRFAQPSSEGTKCQVKDSAVSLNENTPPPPPPSEYLIFPTHHHFCAPLLAIPMHEVRHLIAVSKDDPNILCT